MNIQLSPTPLLLYKTHRILREHLLKVSKHSSPVTALHCNKIVFTVLVIELMRLNGLLTLFEETKLLSCSEKFHDSKLVQY